MRLHGRHLARVSALCLIAVLAVTGGVPAIAQNVQGPGAALPSSGSGSSSKSLARVVSGVKAYKAGKMDGAISGLSVALSSGGLSSKDLAKALYYRGLAYRRKQQPAEAIADLTSALWLKGGLSESERLDAMKNRSGAYREAGIQEPGGASPQSAGAPAKTTANPVAKPAVEISNGGKAGKSSGGGAGWKTATQTSTNSGAAVDPNSLQVAPVSGGASSNSGGSVSNPLAGVGTFFSDLFGGSSSSSASAGKAVTTTGTVAPGGGANATLSSPSTVIESPSTGPVGAVSGWNSQTKPSSGSSKSSGAQTKTAAVAPAAVNPVAFKGRYRVRLAAVRSRDEAAKVVSLFEHNHAATLGGRQMEIAPESFGNMGTFYNVQVGPFVRAKDYKALCTAARSNGYDCLVLKK